ncbi:hypothetical protein [Roseivirga seohaensis]|uniref:hypothetical protein n=1 Tax=Roseivirga seohaensis TaxID=1914963 RepID=UPI003BAD7147
MHNPFLEAERINKSMETALPWPPEVMEEMKAHVAEYHTERARFTALETKLAKEEKRPVDHAKINTYIAAHMQLYVTEKARSNRHCEAEPETIVKDSTKQSQPLEKPTSFFMHIPNPNQKP